MSHYRARKRVTGLSKMERALGREKENRTWWEKDTEQTHDVQGLVEVLYVEDVDEADDGEAQQLHHVEDSDLKKSQFKVKFSLLTKKRMR